MIFAGLNVILTTCVPSDAMFLEGMGATVIVEDCIISDGDSPTLTASNAVVLGNFGILHPEVLTNFKLLYPVSAVELNLQALL